MKLRLEMSLMRSWCEFKWLNLELVFILLKLYGTRKGTKSYENPGSPNKSPLLKKGQPSLR